MPLFEVVFLSRPTKKELEDGAVETLLYGPKAVVARDMQGAAIAAAIGEDAPKGMDIQRTEVLVRPFANPI